MKYCKRCLLPDVRPGIALDAEGVCSACRGHEDKESHIDWAGRAEEFSRVIADARARSNGYDCIVPVSGGKDSWYQVIKAKEYGLKVLTVTWRTPARTAIGQQNVDNMIHALGVDHIDYTINPEVERKFTKAAFVRKGATAIPMHMAIFAIPTRLAVQLRIPMVLWGENPQLEFGGPEKDRLSTELNLEWVRRFGVTNSTSWQDWVGAEGLTESDMVVYRLPEEAEFVAWAPRSIFLGSFFKWNSFENAEIAKSHGFKSGDDFRKTGTWSFADLDCDFISLHHFLKWYKFGINRAFDNLSVQIRYGMIDRNEAIRRLREIGHQIPSEDIKKFCDFVGEPQSWFWQIVESYRNKNIWTLDGNVWKIRDFLIEDWRW